MSRGMTLLMFETWETGDVTVLMFEKGGEGGAVGVSRCQHFVAQNMGGLFNVHCQGVLYYL